MTNINLIKQSISVFEESLAEYQQMKTDAIVLGNLSELSAINNAIVCTKTALEALQNELDRIEILDNNNKTKYANMSTKELANCICFKNCDNCINIELCEENSDGLFAEIYKRFSKLAKFEENKPLNLEDLKNMVGEPVWHNGECDVIQEVFEDEKHIGDWYIDTYQGTIAISQFNKFYEHKPKGDEQ